MSHPIFRKTAIGVGLFWLAVFLFVIVQSVLNVPIAGIKPEAVRLIIAPISRLSGEDMTLDSRPVSLDALSAEDGAAVALAVSQAASENTRRAYRQQWAAFTTWASAQGYPSLPALDATLAAYLTLPGGPGPGVSQHSPGAGRGGQGAPARRLPHPRRSGYGGGPPGHWPQHRGGPGPGGRVDGGRVGGNPGHRPPAPAR